MCCLWKRLRLRQHLIPFVLVIAVLSVTHMRRGGQWSIHLSTTIFALCSRVFVWFSLFLSRAYVAGTVASHDAIAPSTTAIPLSFTILPDPHGQRVRMPSPHFICFFGRLWCRRCTRLYVVFASFVDVLFDGDVVCVCLCVTKAETSIANDHHCYDGPSRMTVRKTWVFATVDFLIMSLCLVLFPRIPSHPD